MQSALAEGVFPGAVVFVRLRGRVAYHRAFGLAARIPLPEPASTRTIYDLASLTKPLATATALVFLAQDGRIDLTLPVQAVLHELEDSPVGRASVGHLLSHRSGLPAWRPYYEQIAKLDRAALGSPDSGAGQAALRLIRDEPLEGTIGGQARYSDLGFMLLGFLIARLSGQSLAQFCRQKIYAPLGVEDLFFIPSNGTPVGSAADAHIDPCRIAPTEDDPWRARLVRGEVHDENAFALGGVAGHSGLFGTATAVARISGCWVDALLGRDSILSSTWVRTFMDPPDRSAIGSWVHGWDTPSAPSSSGAYFSPASFGHLGFTGTSLWVDTRTELEVVLLSNRVHPTRKNEAIRGFRPKIHNVIYQEFAGRSG